MLSKSKVKMLYESGLSERQIGDKLGCSRSPITRILNKLGLPRRTNAESISALSKSKVETFTPHQEQLVLGSMLGDAGLYWHHFKSNKTEREIHTLRMDFSHSIKQLEYLMHKCRLLNGGKIQTHTSAFGSIIKKFSLSHTPTLMPYSELCLDQKGKKLVTMKWVERLNYIGLAYWYVDDGALIITNGGTCPKLHFYTNSYRPEERLVLANKLREFGLDTREAKTPNHNHDERILVSRHKPEAVKFMEQIRPWVVPSMAYKIRYILEGL